MFAAWCDPLGCSLQDFNDFTARKAAFFFCQPDADALTRQSKWDKDCAGVIQTPHGLAAISQGGQSEFVEWISHKQMTMRNP